MAFAYFPVLISVGYEFLKGSFASESQLIHPKMCKIFLIQTQKKKSGLATQD